jgi:hypothetical protein
MAKSQLTLALPGTDPKDEDRAMMGRLREIAEIVGAPFELRAKSITVERTDAGHYGICYDDGRIKIRLRHATTGRMLRESSLVNTVCHELAHLEHMNHGDEFKALFARVLEFARDRGIYKPQSNAPSSTCGIALPREAPRARVEEPEQLSLVLPVITDFRRRKRR